MTTVGQKESLTYKDWNGNSQWYALKDTSNNWALNSATGGLDSFKAYQSTNSGDTYVNASNASGVVRVNYETGAGTAFKVYGGSSSLLYASFSGTTSIQFPGLAASSGRDCLQIDNSGYVTNTGAACGSGTGGSGTVTSGTAGQIAYYISNGTSLGGTNTVPVTAGGTGAATSAGALANLGGISFNRDFATDDGRAAHSKCQWSGHSYSIWREGRLHGKWFDCVLHGQSCRDSGGNRRSVFDWRERVLPNKSFGHKPDGVLHQPANQPQGREHVWPPGS